MSVDTYHQLKETDASAAHQYLGSHFNDLFSEAIGLFAAYGWGAITMALLMAMLSWASWWRLRKQLPWGWLWLLPVLGFTLYAAVKASVIAQLIELAPELQQMWELYFRYWTPLKMIRTSVTGLLLTTVAMWCWIGWQRRQS